MSGQKYRKYFSFSTFGGYTFDKIGFKNSTLVIIGLQLIATLTLFGMWIYNKNKNKTKTMKKSWKYNFLSELNTYSGQNKQVLLFIQPYQYFVNMFFTKNMHSNLWISRLFTKVKGTGQNVYKENSFIDKKSRLNLA